MNRKLFCKTFFAALAGLTLLTLIGCSGRLSEPRGKATFEGASTDLKHTQVVATLDEPITSDNNVIWCASFQSAWKELQNDIIKEPIEFQSGSSQADSLNQAADPKPTIPVDCLYATAGWKRDGIVVKIQEEMKKRFPDRKPPEFKVTDDLVAVAYAYLEANVKFTLPYFQNRSPLSFTSADGKETPVQSFELPSFETIIDKRLRAQPALLFFKWGKSYEEFNEFAVDLDRNSKPSQIVVAVVEPGNSLAETLQKVEERIAQYKINAIDKSTDVDMLLVPDMCWRISHSYDELVKKYFKNKAFPEHFLGEARQDIAFRLDRSGAELSSEARVMLEKCAAPPPCIVNRPFLVYMKKRGAKTPYFVMWVANAELLTPWDG